MILLIDNYDSFSYNLYQMIGGICPDIRVVRNDELTVEQVEALHPSHIFLSPGPGRPADAGICVALVQKLRGKIPIFGVCLGFQAICEAYGGVVDHAPCLMHGKTSEVTADPRCTLFKGMPARFPAARYHSLAAVEATLPPALAVTARAAERDGSRTVMAVCDEAARVYGVQFHPESILTPNGETIVRNFLEEGHKVIREAIIQLTQKKDLSFAMAEQVMDEIMSGQASELQIGAYLIALSMKGETIDEIAASAKGMRSHAVKLLHDRDVLEIVGTGGDHSNSFNISTTSALVVAAAGVPVAKHGNRAASSKCGAADVLEALGVDITVSPEKSRQLLNNSNICFLFAQKYHLAMKYVAPVRKELAVRTIFNILGPLSNPAGANLQLMGVYDPALLAPLAGVMMRLGVYSGMVVYGQDGLDEISMSAPTDVCEIKDGKTASYTITPEQFGLTRCTREELVGGTPAENAAITRAILEGEKGPRRDAVLLNSAAALHIARGMTMEEGLALARETLDSGKALAKLEEFIRISNEP